MSAQPASRYAAGSAANLVRSLLVILVIMVAVFFMVPRTNSISRPAVDVDSTAVAVARSSGLPIEMARDLPQGWRATSVRYVRSTDDVMTWHIGYLTPDNQSVAVEQAKDPTTDWIRAEVNRATQTGTRRAGDRNWATYVRSSKVQNSLVQLDVPSGGLTTIVTGTGSFDQLALVAEHLEPVKVTP